MKIIDFHTLKKIKFYPRISLSSKFKLANNDNYIIIDYIRNIRPYFSCIEHSEPGYFHKYDLKKTFLLDLNFSNKNINESRFKKLPDNITSNI